MVCKRSVYFSYATMDAHLRNGTDFAVREATVRYSAVESGYAASD